MLWLERNLAGRMGLSDNTNRKQEGFLSITGEKGADHTAILVRPSSISNSDWAEILVKINAASDKGLDEAALKAIDPRLLGALVLDPYFKRTGNVSAFVKGWSTIRVS
jgi:hypothetical protein